MRENISGANKQTEAQWLDFEIISAQNALKSIKKAVSQLKGKPINQ